ncbi:hypothetical protein ZWY2020_013424 [Hordeum vulgare]|nr:hypothetical protein ZWY2020_013424 [Hordeum vulgare]
MFLVAWAAVSRGSSVPPVPTFRRSLVSPRPIAAHPCHQRPDRPTFLPLSSAPPPPATVAATAVNRIYHIAAADVAALRTMAGPGRTKLRRSPPTSGNSALGGLNTSASVLHGHGRGQAQPHVPGRRRRPTSATC